PSLADALRAFWDRTLGFQLDRDSPFSIWDWGQYHAARIPELESLQTVSQVGTIVLAGVSMALPRDKGPLELAALSAALLVAFELSLTHWSYLYLPWVLPFVLLALFLPRTRVRPEPEPTEPSGGTPARRGRRPRRSRCSSGQRWPQPSHGSSSATPSRTSLCTGP